jgi:transcriptional regulator with XRE-family HTH domain
MKKRSQKIILTKEAHVLRALRKESGLSMKRAATQMGVSDSTIAHIETGRMNPPHGSRLERMLAVYGGIKENSFYERVRLYSEQSSPRDELADLLARASAAQVHTLLQVAKGLLG